MSLNNNIDFNPNYFEQKEYHFRVGNGYFDDDVWDFNGLSGTTKRIEKCKNRINFEWIKSDDIKLVTKQYILKRLLIAKPNSVNRNYMGLKHFIKFIEGYSIDNYENITRMIIRTYFDTVIKALNNKGEPISRTDIFHRTTPIKDMFIEGDRLGWLVPKDCSLWIQQLYKEMILDSPRTNMPHAKTSKDWHNKETVKKIILAALNDKNIYTKAAVVIQTQLGIRINELLSIKEGCIKEENGNTVIEYITHKVKKEDVIVTAYANPLVCAVVKELDDFTKPLRKKIGSQRLFVHSVRYNSLICEFNNPSNFNRDYIKPFLKRHNIEQDNVPINLTDHYFRHYFAQGAWRKGASITEISEALNHDSLMMTEAYTYNLREEVNNKFIDILTSDEMITGPDVANIKQRLKNDNPFKGKTEKEIKLIANAMRIKVLSNGICMHHPLRKEKCPVEDGDCEHCPNFITHKCCLPVHKLRVKRFEDEMDRAKKQGNKVWYEKNKEEKEYIENTYIKPLESKVNKDEQ